ncbi:MAG: lipoate--protein ligase family protein [Verrucomicrobiota bacterium]
MKHLDLTLPSPAENLALEETLLDAAETGQVGEILRFWESPSNFVVVGYANKVASEVNATACEAKGIPILRRCSGGGTVVQGPGCLNYAVILRITEHGPTRSISAANEYIMERTRRAIAPLASDRRPQTADSHVSVRGHTDLALGNLKFSGNAQRRRKNFLLFHGTLLLNFDLPLISEVLNMPSLQPDYREGRGHNQFIMNLGLPAKTVKHALIAEWGATAASTPPMPIPPDMLLKYNSVEWNRKF